jgi:hypothetical protein
MQNRKRAPPPESAGDAFDRQRVIPGFDQTLVEAQGKWARLAGQG